LNPLKRLRPALRRFHLIIDLPYGLITPADPEGDVSMASPSRPL